MHLAHEWHVAPWEWAGCPELAGLPVWRTWATVYLRAMNARQRHLSAGRG